MKKHSIFFFFLCCLTYPVDSHAATCDRTFTGPLHLPAIGLTEVFEFSPLILGPDETRYKKISYNFSFRWVNIWAYHIESDIPFEKGMDIDSFPFKYGTFLMDVEAMCFSHTISYGLTDRFDLSLNIPLMNLSGGVMDGFIERFHETFGIGQHRRKEMPRNQSQFFYVDKQGNQHWLRKADWEGFNLGNIAVYSGYRIRDCSPAFSIRAAVKLPTISTEIPTGQKGVDGSLLYSLRWRWKNLRCYHGGGATYFSDAGDEPVHYYHWRFSSATTLEYPTRYNFSILAHIVLNTPAADYPALDDYVLEISLGYRKKISRYLFSFALIENLFWYDNSPDFGLFFELARSF